MVKISMIQIDKQILQTIIFRLENAKRISRPIRERFTYHCGGIKYLLTGAMPGT
jgi:hypothetical protein